MVPRKQGNLLLETCSQQVGGSTGQVSLSLKDRLWQGGREVNSWSLHARYFLLPSFGSPHQIILISFFSCFVISFIVVNTTTKNLPP